VTYKKKLIEVALPLATINAESAREKSIRHGHPSTLHLWWARRPLAAARAVLWASLVDDPSAHPEQFPTDEDQQRERDRLFDILERLVPWEASNDERVLEAARAEILKSCDGELPNVLDPFGGGGAIPLESLRLGLPTFTGDLNPVAVLIQRAMLEIPARFANQPPVNSNARIKQNLWEGNRGLASDVRAYGQWMRDEAARRLGQYYPNAVLPNGNEATPIAWIWARTVKSPDPSWPGHVPLVRSWILAKKPGKPVVWVEPIVDTEAKAIRYEVREGGTPQAPSVEQGNGICVATGTPIPGAYIKTEANAGRMGATLLAVVAEGSRTRAYVSPTDRDEPTVPEASFVISGAVPRHLTGGTCAVYGLDEWSKLFTPRQMLALTTFSDLLVEVRQQVLVDASAVGVADDGIRLHAGGSAATARADAIITYLSFVIDKCADFWSSICSWNNAGEKMRQTFSRQAIPMTWDHAEANPFSDSTGNWLAMVEGAPRLRVG
jgi:putative DNA methylase